MNAHIQIDTGSATPVTETKPSLAQLLQAHQKITDLIGTALPGHAADTLREAAEDLLYDVSMARAATWDEFGRKVQLMVDQTTEDSNEFWLTAIQEGVFWDLKHLNGEIPQATE